jgi:uroporphyrinogen-III decarboxylase
MVKETMTSEERVMAAIGLERPDRTPVDILATAAAYAAATGITPAEFYRNEDEAADAIERVFQHTGGWDLDCASFPPGSIESAKLTATIAMGVKLAFPGLELPDDYQPQCLEQEILELADYDTVAETGWTKFMFEDFVFRLMDIAPDDLVRSLADQGKRSRRAVENWRKRGVATLLQSSPFALLPFFRFSMARSLVKFTEDLYNHPERVERALKRVIEDQIEENINGCKALGQRLAFVAEERAGAFFYPLEIFERFWLPYTLELVDALWSEGIVTWIHLDTCWDKNIPYFKRLPRGSAVLALDGTSDIFAAKEVLRDHLCLAGDVHPALLSLGKPEEVEAYCKRLIKEVGGDGGFILSSGCEMPAGVTLENWTVMIQTAQNYMP